MRYYTVPNLWWRWQGWLESSNSSSLNPVNVTTPLEIETSRGDSLTKLLEIIFMMATPCRHT
ncbi:TPA: ash family protein [Morganella morganii]